MSTHRSVATILFTDIVGSTERAAELGDRGWQDLRHRHHAIVREELARWRGREVNESGDGFLAAFDNPAHAILCATTIRERVRELGLEVRCGIHMGEIERSADGSLGGLTLHVGARVAGHGGAGDVLVSTAVRDVEAGSGFEFEDRGRHDLKGIPGQWRLFAVTAVPEEIAPPRRSSWIERLPRRLVRGAIAVAVLLGLAGLYVVIGNRGESFTPDPALAEAAPGIAVLPFTVQGEGLDVMREGMVSLLSTGLDGAGGLRTIAPGTVYARWREQVPGEETPELGTALEVARLTGATYALIGSAVSIGSGIRIVADVYQVETGDHLGQAQVEGSPDDVLPLVDRLGVEVLRVILQGEEELPEIHMAALTTESPQALKAYLEGEVYYRHFDLEAARAAYTRAVEADSMFALAHARLAYAYSWGGSSGSNQALAERHAERARKLSASLPAREALLVRAQNAGINQGVMDVVAALREAVRLHPDDAMMWYWLGETTLHVPSMRSTPEEAERLFGRAVELDPRNAEYLIHYSEFPWWFSRDSARATERLAMLERAAPNSARARGGRLALALAFGDSATQAAAEARLGTVDVDALNQAAWYLFPPRYKVSLRIAHEIYERGDEQQRTGVMGLRALFWRNTWWWGRVREGSKYLDDPEFPEHERAYHVYRHFAFGLPIAEESLEAAIGPARIDSLAHEGVILYAGAFAVDRGRWPDYERARTELKRRAERAFAENDSTAGIKLAGRATALEGYGLWKRGRPEAALSFLEDEQAQEWVVDRWLWLPRLYTELGRYQDAERAYMANNNPPSENLDPLIHRELGKVYEALGEYDKAVEAYEYFVEYWRDADPELQPMVEETRQAILRLRPLQRQ